MKQFSLIAALLFLSVSPGLCQQKRDPVWNYPPELKGARAEVYKTVGDVQLKAWIYEPDRAQFKGMRPAAVFFFGGGWRGGTPGQFARHCEYLASRGMVAVTADYRVSSRHKVKADACVTDCKSAVRWLRTNSTRLKIDPNRIMAAGGSAGGHTAACTGVIQGLEDVTEDLSVSSVPNSLVLFNPAVMLEKFDNDPRWDKLAERRYKTEPLATRTGVPPRELSPIHNVHSGLPPTIIMHGEADDTVPFWTVEAYAKAAKNAGNRCELNGYVGAGHGFFNIGRGGSAVRQDLERRMFARTIVDLDAFLLSLGYVEGEALASAPNNINVHMRGQFQNSLLQFKNRKTGHVVFMGGSITEGNGYRVMVSEWLQKRFPECDFTFTNAGISSTCSTTGAFRLTNDVLKKDVAPIDLFFVEFAVNDDQDAAHAAQECVRGMEGIIRHVRTSSPKTDIVMTHFVNPPILKLLQEGKKPVSIANHETVAIHYGVSSIHLAKNVAERIRAEDITWKDYGGTHPKPFGHKICADMITDLLSAAWKQVSASAKPTAHPVPDAMLDKQSYTVGRTLDSEAIDLATGWSLEIPDWKSIKGGKRDRFTNIKLVSCSTPGSELTVPFSGSAIGAYIVAGPDAGIAEVSIDGGEYKSIDLFHRYSKGLHYPRTVMLATELSNQSHSLRIRLSKDHNKASSGTIVRVVRFVVNGSQKAATANE